MAWTFEPKHLQTSPEGTPRYEQIAVAIEAAINRGDFRVGDRLPTVRALAQQLDVSGASVAVAYSVLARRGRVTAQVGRGTFVSTPSAEEVVPAVAGGQGVRLAREMPRRASASSRALLASSWRRRALRTSERLRALNPDAIVCTASWPDPALLPMDVVRRAFSRMAEQLRAEDMQYSGPEAHPALARAVLPHLERDGVPAAVDGLVVMSSARQMLTLTLRIAPSVLGVSDLVVAVEEPGHYTMYDTVESLGHQLVGIEVDAEGAIPASLDAALRRGANVVLLTPRSHNPTGASWTPARRQALADVLADHPHALIVEDDHFAGISSLVPGSLLGDLRLEERVIYARSFSKAMGPDLRTTLVASRPKLRAQLRDAKLMADGWSPRIIQRALAVALDDPELDIAFTRAREAYAERRAAVSSAMAARLPVGSVAPSADGVNVWLRLLEGSNLADFIHDAAELGVLVSSGEPFYIQPGHADAVRISISWVTADEARQAGEILASAALAVDHVPVPIGI